jgi:hypothetical protein
MAKSSTRPPRAYQEFIRRHPKLREAWKSIREAEDVGPIDQRSARLVKLGVAIGGSTSVLCAVPAIVTKII